MQEAELLRWDIDGTVDYIVAGHHRVIALQFPDDLLDQAHGVYHELSVQLKAAGADVEVRTLSMHSSDGEHRIRLPACCNSSCDAVLHAFPNMRENGAGRA